MMKEQDLLLTESPFRRAPRPPKKPFMLPRAFGETIRIGLAVLAGYGGAWAYWELNPLPLPLEQIAVTKQLLDLQDRQVLLSQSMAQFNSRASRMIIEHDKKLNYLMEGKK